jgi:hypothetical protein
MSMTVKEAPASPAGEYITGRLAQRMLGIDDRRFKRLAEAGHIRRLALPGGPQRYSKPDVERLLQESVK